MLVKNKATHGSELTGCSRDENCLSHYERERDSDNHNVTRRVTMSHALLPQPINVLDACIRAASAAQNLEYDIPAGLKITLKTSAGPMW